MAFDPVSVFSCSFAIIAVYVLCLFFIKPIKLLFKLLLNLAFGGAALYAVNLAGGVLGITAGINLFTSAVAGFMGVPGILLLFALKIFL